MAIQATTNRESHRDRSSGAVVHEELVVLSHLRWTSAWQRPQHVVSRLARGRRTWFVEEPLAVRNLDRPRLRVEGHGEVCRVWLEVPGTEGPVCFSDPGAGGYGAQLAALLGPHGDRAAWLYTPMALPLAEALTPQFVVYDVMDDLASCDGAPPELPLRQRRLLEMADIVFTGGRSLHRSVADQRPVGTHCFPGGVDPHHYAAALGLRRRGPRPVAGYVGVLDERLDLDLVADMAHALPDWRICMVGPVERIDAARLPRARNITYPGPIGYAELPAAMAGFDVGLMPFAHTRATRSSSPTLTLEYLAAGLPVVSTRVPDVMAEFGDIVDVQDDGKGFATACRRALDRRPEARTAIADPTLHWNHWDAIAERMEGLIAAAL